MKQKNSSITSAPFIVFIVFLVLKLVGEIDWSWWWITSPIWISLSLVIVVLIFAGIMAFFLKNKKTS